MALLANPTINIVEHQRELILALPKPRRVSLDWKNKALALIAALAIIGFYIWCLSAPKNGRFDTGLGSRFNNFALPLVVGVAIPLLLGFYIVKQLSELEVVRDGECVVGKITRQKRFKVGRGSTSRVAYSFPVGSGKPMNGCATDLTASYRENMSVLVFYDPEDISRNIAYCCTWWRVQDTTGNLLTP